tara:strand:+ start:1126 stop:1437 length:312 start_codon:yes stop_codon:yes gene_type:complete
MQNNTHSTTPVPTAHPRPYTKLETRLIALLTEVKEEFDIYKAQIDKVLTELSGETVVMKGSDGNPDYFSDTIGRELQKHPTPQRMSEDGEKPSYWGESSSSTN